MISLEKVTKVTYNIRDGHTCLDLTGADAKKLWETLNVEFGPVDNDAHVKNALLLEMVKNLEEKLKYKDDYQIEYLHRSEVSIKKLQADLQKAHDQIKAQGEVIDDLKKLNASDYTSEHLIDQLRGELKAKSDAIKNCMATIDTQSANYSALKKEFSVLMVKLEKVQSALSSMYRLREQMAKPCEDKQVKAALEAAERALGYTNCGY